MCKRVEIHLLNLLDGTPYYVPPSNIIGRSFSPGVSGVIIKSLVVTSSRLMLCICSWESAPPPRQEWTCVWGWKTGNLVIVLWFE